MEDYRPPPCRRSHGDEKGEEEEEGGGATREGSAAAKARKNKKSRSWGRKGAELLLTDAELAARGRSEQMKRMFDALKDQAPLMPAETDASGNVEYKYRLLGLSSGKLAHLASQMQWRMNEGQGTAIYFLGITNDGKALGLCEAEFEESVATLRQAGQSLGRAIRLEVVRRFPGLAGDCAEVKLTAAGNTLKSETRVMFVGPDGAGKSSLIGTLTSGVRDNGSGRARFFVTKHKHEVNRGRTSSVSTHPLSGGEMLAGTPEEGYFENVFADTMNFLRPTSLDDDHDDEKDVEEEEDERRKTTPRGVARKTQVVLIDTPGDTAHFKSLLRGLSARCPDVIVATCVLEELLRIRHEKIVEEEEEEEDTPRPTLDGTTCTPDSFSSSSPYGNEEEEDDAEEEEEEERTAQQEQREGTGQVKRVRRRENAIIKARDATSEERWWLGPSSSVSGMLVTLRRLCKVLGITLAVVATKKDLARNGGRAGLAVEEEEDEIASSFSPHRITCIRTSAALDEFFLASQSGNLPLFLTSSVTGEGLDILHDYLSRLTTLSGTSASRDTDLPRISVLDDGVHGAEVVLRSCLVRTGVFSKGQTVGVGPLPEGNFSKWTIKAMYHEIGGGVAIERACSSSSLRVVLTREEENLVSPPPRKRTDGDIRRGMNIVPWERVKEAETMVVPQIRVRCLLGVDHFAKHARPNHHHLMVFAEGAARAATCVAVVTKEETGEVETELRFLNSVRGLVLVNTVVFLRIGNSRALVVGRVMMSSAEEPRKKDV